MLRFKTVGVKLARELRRERQPDADLLFNKTLCLPDERLKLEGEVISQALAKVNGQITKAAKLLGIRYQTLAFIIEARHPDLVKQRSPIKASVTQSDTAKTQRTAKEQRKNSEITVTERNSKRRLPPRSRTKKKTPCPNSKPQKID